VASILDAFHPAVRTWFERRFGSPSRAQELGWPRIAEAQSTRGQDAPADDIPGHDVLLCAPTGSGKTLAAFMWAINRLVCDAADGALSDHVSVLYVSPLKALANDIRLNLEEPLDGVRAVAAELGLEPAPIRAGLRTGDTPAGERSAMLRRPPHILVTTPESLFILLTSAKFREKLRAVRYVIVDELHAIAGNKRGAHLMLTLERLERLVRSSGAPRPARIGLSATLNPIEALAAFLAGADVDRNDVRTPRAVRIVRADDRPRPLDLQVIAPGPDLTSLATHQHWEAMYDALASLIRDHRTTLVFTLSRRWAERIALALQKKLGTDAVMAHHGSLARAERLAAEQKLKRGDLKAIVATASLELGIDVGAVDLVCQVDSPKSISAAIQRIGRSGHTLGGTPKGRLFALTLDDLLEAGAAVRAMRLRHLDEVEFPSGCVDVAAQQIVAIAAEEDEIATADLLRILRSTHNFANFGADELAHLLDQMSVQLPERIQGANPKIFHDRINGRIRARRAARLSAITSGGTIPESGNYDVVIASEGRKIGDVEEDFAQESVRGDIFSLGSTPWEIRGISKNRLLVEPAPGMAPSLPFWQTEAAGRSPALSADLCDLRRHIADIAASSGEKAATDWLVAECALEEAAAAQAVAYVRRGVAALGVVPDENHIAIERFFDGLGGTQIVIHSPLGIRLNRGFGLALRKRLCQSFDFEIQASAIDDAILLALNSRHSFPLDHVLTLITSRTARDILIQALLDSPMFEVRFRHVATRALAVMRSARGRKVPAWIQRLRTQELITALFPQRNACFENRPPAIDLPDHFMVGETIRECLEETADLQRLLKLLSGIEDGSVRTVLVDSTAPSVFAHRVLLAWDYSFLDDGERANRRSRTVTMNRAMAEDVFRTEDLAQMLSQEAVDRVAAEIGGRAPSSRARNADELYELIRAHGSLRPSGLTERVNGDSAALMTALSASGRIVTARVAADAAEVLLAAEDLALFAAAYTGFQVISADGMAGPIPPNKLDPPFDSQAAQEELVRCALATSRPITVADLAARLWLGRSEVEGALAALESKGAIFQGHFTGGDSTLQWCDRYVLERIHRNTLTLLRAEVEPCTDREFTAFRLKWQHLDDPDAPAGLDGVRAAMHQLSGLGFAPEFWERAILPARLADYRAEYLDLLCMSGEVAWVATPASEESAGAFPSLIAFAPRGGGLLAPVREVPDDDAQARLIAEKLSRFGAQYLDQLAERAGLSERDTLAALWRLAALGLVSNDCFAPLRLLWSDPDAINQLSPDRARRGTFTRHDAALRARLKSSVSGRWSLVESKLERPDNEGAAVKPAVVSDDGRDLADLLLKRHGLLTREMMALEGFDISWQELVFALRRMEYSGLIRRGWFVRSLSGEQYALPEALEMLRSERVPNRVPGRPIALSAADPANPYGVLLPGCGVSRDAGNLLVIRNGVMIMALAGKSLTTPEPLNDEEFHTALAALMKLRPKLAIETIDEIPALESDRVHAMAAMRFHSDGRSLIYDGLPGPAPSRTIASRVQAAR
jgi:ATP-dependent Lhr-like helicase